MPSELTLLEIVEQQNEALIALQGVIGEMGGTAYVGFAYAGDILDRVKTVVVLEMEQASET